MFTVSISGLGYIVDEYEKAERDIEQKINKGLKTLGSEMKQMLDVRIGSDVYAIYHPRKYWRRSENSGEGTPLWDDSNKQVEVSGTEMAFFYYPTGEHANPEWSGWHEGDSLIEWLQIRHPKARPAALPFWNNFVDDVKDYALYPIIDALTGYVVTDDGNSFILDGTEKFTEYGEE